MGGLGLDGLALEPEFSFLNMLAADGNLAHSSFGIFLADNEDDFSEISFGGHNSKRLISELAWAPVAMPELGHWQVRITAIRIGGKKVDFCADGQCRAVIDSGTSSIAVPSSFSDVYLGDLGNSILDPPLSQSGVTDCKKAIGHLLQFELEGATLDLGPGDYARASVQLAEEDGEAEEVAALAALEKEVPNSIDGIAAYEGAQAGKKLPEVKCLPMFMPMDLPEPLGPKLFILGEPVLQKYYTVYNWEEKSVGFGLAHHKVSKEGYDGTGPGMRDPLPALI